MSKDEMNNDEMNNDEIKDLKDLDDMDKNEGYEDYAEEHGQDEKKTDDKATAQTKKNGFKEKMTKRLRIPVYALIITLIIGVPAVLYSAGDIIDDIKDGPRHERFDDRGDRDFDGHGMHDGKHDGNGPGRDNRSDDNSTGGSIKDKTDENTTGGSTTTT